MVVSLLIPAKLKGAGKLIGHITEPYEKMHHDKVSHRELEYHKMEDYRLFL